MSNRPLSFTFLSVLLLAALLATCSPLRNIPASVSVLDTGQQPGASTSKRSTAFVPNPEQTNPALLFRTLGSAGTLFFGRHEVVFPLSSPDHTAALSSGLPETSTSDLAMPTEPTTLRLRFVGGNPDTHVVGEEQLPGIVNYFIGNDPAKWHTNIPTYGSIVYEQLYPGIDLFYSGGESFLKGTFVVAPGANPGDIRWRYDGASRVELSQGELLISVAENGEDASLIERKPVAWQTVAGKRSPVDVRYVVHGDGSIDFTLGRYDATQPLIIDPTLDYSTYFGGIGFDGSAGIAVDCNNHVYIGGVTDSPDFPDPGTIAGELDVFVTKLDLSQTGANQLVYTTYVGGANRERVLGIEVDCSGKAHVIGYTESNDLPTTANAFQPDFQGGGVDGIVVQLDAAGAIHYVSYLGGTDFEELVQVAVGDNGLMYVVGFTCSPDFPTTDDAFQKTKAGVEWRGDALVSVLDTSKSGAASLVYSTYYGGSEFDEGYAIDVSDGIIYFAGHSQSDNLSLENPIQAVNNGGGGSGDAYLVKLDPSQSGDDQLLFATYLGGTADEVSGGVAVDASGNVYWGGTTGSADFPTTAISPLYGGGEWDAFLVKLDTTTPSLIYSTLVGGSGDDGIRHIVVDGSGNAYVTGGTGSDDFPTVNPIQDTWKGGVASEPELSWYGPGDGMVAKFDTTGAMTFGTYLGGAGAEAGMGIVLDALGNVYVAGGTESTDLETVDPFQDANAGGFDVFIASIGGLAPPTVDLSIGKLAGRDAIIAGQRITYTITITNAGPTTPVTATVVDSWTPVTAVVGVHVPGCDVNLPGGIVTCTVTNIVTSTPSHLTLVVTTSAIYSGTLSNTAVVTPTGVVTDTNDSNNRAGPVEVTVYEPVEAGFTAWPTSGVAPLTVVFTNTSSGDYTTSLWDFGDGVTGTLESPTHTYAAAGVYTVTLTVSGPGGMDTLTRPHFIIVYGPVQADFTAGPTSGPAPLTVVFTNTSTGDYTTSLWDFGDGITGTLESPTHTYTAAGVYTVTLTVSGPGGTDTLTRPHFITTYEPVEAGFTGWPTSGAAPLMVAFTNTSNGDYTTSLWDFGDGITGTLESPTHTYTAAGAYTVTLTVSGPGGTDTSTRTNLITVYEPVQAGFTAGPTSGVAALTVAFTNTSSGDYTASLWEFGDGITGTLESPTHTYTAAGAYTVTLTVSGPGDSDAETKAGYITVKYGVYLPLTLRASDGVAKAPPSPPRHVDWRPRGHYPSAE